MFSRRVTGIVLGALVAGGLPLGMGTASGAEAPSVIFVVDVSGSMSGAPLEQAKQALTSSVATIPAGTQVGLRSYEGPCGDGGDLLVPVGTGNRADLSSAISGLAAGGGTPTPDALRAAYGDLPASGDRTIVLISDGNSGCGDPCPTAAQLAQDGGVEFRAHTVGFNAPQTAETELACIARVTGGQYFSVSDSAGVAAAVGTALGGRQPLRYVALGDSYAAGEGIKDYFKTDKGKDNACHRSPLAWSFQLNARSAQIDGETLNAACTGAVTADVRYRWYKGEQPQINRLRQLNDEKGKPDVGLVTIGIGGNDANFPVLVASCFLFGPTANALLTASPPTAVPAKAAALVGKADCAPLIQAQRALGYGTLTSNLTATLVEAHAAAPNAKIALVSYPQVLPSRYVDTTGCGWLSASEHAQARSLVGELNLAQFRATEAARAKGVPATFIDITDALKGHELCTADSEVNPVMGLGFWPQEMAHPNALGHVSMAKAVHAGLVTKGLIYG